MNNLNRAEENGLREVRLKVYRTIIVPPLPSIKFVSLVGAEEVEGGGRGWLARRLVRRMQEETGARNRYFSLFLVPRCPFVFPFLFREIGDFPGLTTVYSIFSPTHPHRRPFVSRKNLTDEIHSPSPAVCTGSVRDREGVECRVNTCRFGARCQRMAK